jgi:S-formylglutathione hydrolase FrmB
MALFQSSVYSDALGMNTTFNVVIPQKSISQIGVNPLRGNEGIPTVFLLHGNSDDHSIWLRRSSIERYAEERGIAVVMPDAHRSYYTNTCYGLQYFDFIADELPQIVKTFFNLQLNPKSTFIAGLSMGGYGAFKIALKRPDRFTAAASLSGVMDVLDMYEIRRGDEKRLLEFNSIFGPKEGIDKNEHDLFEIASKLKANGQSFPKLYTNCGTEDFLYQQNLKWMEFCRAQSIDLTWSSLPGNHNLQFWDQTICDVLDWLINQQ